MLAAGAGAALVALGALPTPRLDAAGLAAVVLLAASIVWSGISVAWSIAPDRSWDGFNRGLVYLALFVVGILVGTLVERAPRAAATGLAVALGLVVLWALAGKVVPALGPENERSARLRAPVGYWNALALVLGMSLPFWLWLAARRAHGAAARAGATVLLTATLVAIALTTSRGGVVVGAIAIAAWLSLGGPRLESLAALIVAGPVALAIAFWAVQRPGLAQPGAAASATARDGALFGIALAAAAIVVYSVARRALRAEPVESAPRRRLERVAVVVAGAIVGLALAAGIARVGDPMAWARARVNEFRNPPGVQVTNAPDRLVAFSSNHRWTWWRESGRIFADHPALGTGAATFPLARRPLRSDTQAPIAPHNLALQALSETGLVGALLLGGFAVAAALAVARALRRLRGEERAAAAALAAALVAYLAHALIDIGWEYVAASAPFLLALGVLLASGRPGAARRARRPRAALAVGAVTLTALASLASPWLADRRIEDAYAAFARGADGEARARAEQASALNPLSVEPLHVRALAAELTGDLDGAERLLRDAVDLQPQNPETWYELGRFQFQARRDVQTAYCYLDRAYALDRRDVDTGELLDEVRAAGGTGRPCS